MKQKKDYEIITADTAGFCFGVNRAVEIVNTLIRENKKVATLGPIIHNKAVISQFKREGVRVINDVSELNGGEIMVIRSHGAPKEVFEKAKNIEIKDATCIFVSKIHRIVKRHSDAGDTVVIVGDPNHPEVVGIKSYAGGKSYIVTDEAQLKDLIESENLSQENCVLVAQTTFIANIYDRCKKVLKNGCTNFKIYDTICEATSKRQEQAHKLAQMCDMMLVVGDLKSSNTKKLFNTCTDSCRTYLVESASDLKNINPRKCTRVGITAGASTPAGIIEEVGLKMEEILNNQFEGENQDGLDFEQNAEVDFDREGLSFEQNDGFNLKQDSLDYEQNSNTDISNNESFEQLLNSSSQQAFARIGSKVRGTVTSVSKSEVQVDLESGKLSGVIPACELTRAGNKDPQATVKEGDEIEAIVIKKNEQDGILTLSKKRADEILGYERMVGAKKSGEVLKGQIVSVVKGGVLALVDNVDVFIPLSHISEFHVGDPNKLLGQEAEFKIIEADVSRKKAVGSIRIVAEEKHIEEQSDFWNNVKIGQKYKGIVRTIKDYGVFVDIGGIDGMIHVSDLSWHHVGHPSEILSVGDEIEVYIKDINDQTHKIALGYKKEEDNPFEIFKTKYHVGDIVDVKITGLTGFGAFAEIMPDVEGLIHVSQIAQNRIDKPSDCLQMGQQVKVKIVKIDNENQKVGLSIKALLRDERIKESEENKRAVENIDGVELS